MAESRLSDFFSPLSPKFARKAKGKEYKDSPPGSPKSKRTHAMSVVMGSPELRKAVSSEKSGKDGLQRTRFSLSFDSLHFGGGKESGSAPGSPSTAGSGDEGLKKGIFNNKKRQSKKLQKELLQAEEELMQAYESRANEELLAEQLLQKNHQIMKLKDAVAREQRATKDMEEKLKATQEALVAAEKKLQAANAKLREGEERMARLEKDLEVEKANNAKVYAWCIDLNEENARLKEA
eukprot:comp23904_c0_seq1/m.42086 comp23904_c0_seq1/g.42086  ORF comp23904_c0_seq1/g.42086 comp23904_c0_seq1/m.42086 type:complete len:236 (-) comp23904_c0_seq1:297-1004(-)